LVARNNVIEITFLRSFEFSAAELVWKRGLSYKTFTECYDVVHLQFKCHVNVRIILRFYEQTVFIVILNGRPRVPFVFVLIVIPI